MNAPAPTALTDTCPRCGGGFHCGVQDGHCACFGLRLDAALQADLAGKGAQDVKKPG